MVSEMLSDYCPQCVLSLLCGLHQIVVSLAASQPVIITESLCYCRRVTFELIDEN